jgi:hypothetical protein
MIEFSLSDPCKKGRPFTWGEHQDWAMTVLGVADRDPVINESDLYAPVLAA